MGIQDYDKISNPLFEWYTCERQASQPTLLRSCPGSLPRRLPSSSKSGTGHPTPSGVPNNVPKLTHAPRTTKAA